MEPSVKCHRTTSKRSQRWSGKSCKPSRAERGLSPPVLSRSNPTRSLSSGFRLSTRPSSRARLRPAFTLSIIIIRLRFSSATADTIPTSALPNGAPIVEVFPERHELDTEMIRRVEPCKKCRTLRAKGSAGNTKTVSNSFAVGGREHLIASRALRLGPADPVAVLLWMISNPRCAANRRRSRAWVSGF
jgi:hypothetical protein